MPAARETPPSLEHYLTQQAAESQSQTMPSEAAVADDVQVTELEGQLKSAPSFSDEIVVIETDAGEAKPVEAEEKEAQVAQGQEGEEKPKSKWQLLRMKRAAAKKAAAEAAAAAEAEAAGREQGDAAEQDAEKGQDVTSAEDKGKATAVPAKGGKVEGAKPAAAAKGAKAQEATSAVTPAKAIKGTKASEVKPASTPSKIKDAAAVTPAKKEGPKTKAEPSATKKVARSRPSSEDDEPSTKKQKSDAQPKINKNDKTTNIYVGDLPPNTHADDLRDCFTKLGAIRRFHFKSHYAFIDFEEPAAAQLAVERYHLGWFMERQIRVELAAAGDKGPGGGGKPTLQPNAKSGFSGPAGAAASGQSCFKCGRQGHKLKDCRSKVDIRGPRTSGHQWQPNQNQQPAPFYPAAPFVAPVYGPPAPQAYQPYPAQPYGYPAYAAPQQWYAPPQQGQGYYPQPQPQGAYPQQQPQQPQQLPMQGGAYPQQPLVNEFVPQGNVEQRPPPAFNGPQSGRGARGYERPPHQEGGRAFQPQQRTGGSGPRK